MWSDGLVFCDCGFQSVCPLMEKDKRLMEASWWETLTKGETGSCSDGWGHALKLKKVGKTTRPFRYDLNQIPYDYTVEVRNRFKRLDLIECLMNYGPEVHDIVQETGIKTIPKKKKCKQAKWLFEEALQIAQKRSKKQRRKGKIYPFEWRVPKNSKER